MHHLPSSLFLTILRNISPHSPVPLIYPPFQKAKYLQESGVDLAIFMPFNAEFSQIPYEQFLTALKKQLNYTHLALGSDAVFGKTRKGNESNVRSLAPRLGIEVDYLPKFTLNGIPISSGRIRALISQGKLQEAQACLGRPYSLIGHLHDQTISAKGLCLPPKGIYPVYLQIEEKIHLGKAHIDSEKQKIHLEFLNPSLSHTDQDIEIFF